MVSKRIGDVVDIVKGKKPRKIYDFPVEGSLPYVLAASFDTNKYEQYTDDEKCPRCTEEDVLVLWDGSRAGRVSFGKAGYIGSTIAALKGRDKNSIFPKFLYYFLSMNCNLLTSNTAGTGIPHVQKDILENITLPSFSLNEQRKIAAILSTVDEAIEKTQAIIEKTEKVKKGLMQQLLTKGIGHTKFNPDIFWTQKNRDPYVEGITGLFFCH